MTQQPGGLPTGGYPPYRPDHPRATLSLVLGLVALVACSVLGPFAWVTGKRTLDEIDASGGAWGGRGAAQAGYVLGIVATVLLGLAVVGLLLMLLVFGTLALSVGTR